MAVSRSKAKEILRHGEVHGKKLTPRQRRFFGARAGGAPMPKHTPKHRSPDSYNDTALGETPPRAHYSATQEGMGAKHAKRGGGVPAGVKQMSGTDNLRADAMTKQAGVRSTPSGRRNRWPSGVDHFSDSEV